MSGRRHVAAVTVLAAAAGCGRAPSSSTLAAGATTTTSEQPQPAITKTADPTAGLAEVLDMAAARAFPPRASRSRQRAATAASSRAASPPAGGNTRTVVSTAYCLTGVMANGQPARRGAVAMNSVPLGSIWQIEGGGTYVVADRVGHGSQFDIAMPGDCDAARAYGRRTVTVRRVG